MPAAAKASRNMPIRATCPSCDKSYTLNDALAGKSLRCKSCGEVFQVSAATPARPTTPIRRPSPTSREAVRSGSPTVVRRRVVEEDENDRPRKKKRKKKQSADRTPFIVGIAVAGGILVASVITFLVVAIRPVPVPPAVAKPAPQKQEVAAGKPAPFPKEVPVLADQVPAKQAAEEAPANFYGNLEGEQIAAADPGLPDTVLRPRADDTLYKLSNARIGQPSRRGFGPPVGNKAILIDYQVLRRGKFYGGSIVVYGGDGHRASVSISLLPNQERGTIELVPGFGPFGGQLPKNAEIYMVRTDARYKQPITMKVSNSTILGAMAFGTKARNWTKEEIATYLKGPPNYNHPNAHPEIGKDTAWAGTHNGGIAERYLEPEGHLLGFEANQTDWQKEQVFFFLKPILARDQPLPFRDKVHMAKEGYAVAGLEVRADKELLNAFKLHFRKLKADGSLDATDAYTSDWIGPAPENGKGTMLGNTGERVIGANLHRLGAHVSGVALVMAK
jgi:transposase-like protein